LKIFLTGFMGVGKTTVGRLLAERLDVPFVDLDAAIERESGLHVSEIFARHGEERFRALEREALLRCADLAGCVVATGGGTPIDPRNRAWMARQGRVVWINLPSAQIRRRLHGTWQRPLYRDPERAEILLQERLPAYREHDLEIAAEGRSVEEVVARILEELEALG